MLREFELAPASGDLGKIRFRDAADRKVLACAVAAQVDIIVTGDKALQDLAVVGAIPIVSPRVFWERILAHAALGK